MNKIVVSYSELDTYRQCPKKHQWSYRERWSKDATGARDLGTLFHACMEAHYLFLKERQVRDDTVSPHRGAIAEKGVLARCREIVEYEVLRHIEDPEKQSLLRWMYEGYVEQHGCDPDWRILEVECRDEMPLGKIWVDNEAVQVYLKTKIDLIVEDLDRGGIWIVDHKSGKNLSSMLELDLDAQFDIYWWLKRRQGVPVLGAWRNEARTTRNQADRPGYTGKSKPQTLDQRHQRIPLHRTDAELDWQAQDTLNCIQAMYSGIPVYSSPNPEACKWKCDFKDVHLLIRKGLPEGETLEDLGFTQDYRRH